MKTLWIGNAKGEILSGRRLGQRRRLFPRGRLIQRYPEPRP
jgi:hypothetical protein